MLLNIDTPMMLSPQIAITLVEHMVDGGINELVFPAAVHYSDITLKHRYYYAELNTDSVLGMFCLW